MSEKVVGQVPLIAYFKSAFQVLFSWLLVA
jgi:hypothetical protein